MGADSGIASISFLGTHPATDKRIQVRASVRQAYMHFTCPMTDWPLFRSHFLIFLKEIGIDAYGGVRTARS